MKKSILFFLMFLMSMPLTAAASDALGSISVKMSSFRSDKGNAQITLFNSAGGFPEKPEKAFKILEAPIANGTSGAVFTDVPYGEYAIAVLHDENGNGKMNRNMMGRPIEGNGASNNPEAFGPPKYKDAKFILNEKTITIDIRIKY